MSSSAGRVGDEIAGTMARIEAASRQAVKDIHRESAAVSRKVILSGATQVPGGDRRFSNMARYNHGGRLNVKTQQRGDALWVLPRGPWKLAETGAAPHRMGRGWHPGTHQGRLSWTRAQAETFRQLERDVPADVERIITEAFLA